MSQSSTPIKMKRDSNTMFAIAQAKTPEDSPKRARYDADVDTAMEAKHTPLKGFKIRDPDWTMNDEDRGQDNPTLTLRASNLIPYTVQVNSAMVRAILLPDHHGTFQVSIDERIPKTLSFLLKINTTDGPVFRPRSIGFDVAAEAMLHSGVVSYFGAHLAPMWEDRETMHGILVNLEDKEEDMLSLKRSDKLLDEDIDSVLYWRAMACQQLKEHLYGEVPCDMDSYIDLKIEMKKLNEDLMRLTEDKSKVNEKMQRLCVEAMTFKSVKDLKGEYYASVLENMYQFIKIFTSVVLMNVPLSYIGIFLQHLEEEYSLSTDFDEPTTYPEISLEHWIQRGYKIEIVTSEQFDYDIEDYIF